MMSASAKKGNKKELDEDLLSQSVSQSVIYLDEEQSSADCARSSANVMRILELRRLSSLVGGGS
jgi:hypothetical protein